MHYFVLTAIRWVRYPLVIKPSNSGKRNAEDRVSPDFLLTVWLWQILNLSKPQTPHLENGNKHIYLIGFFWDIPDKANSQYLAYKCVYVCVSAQSCLTLCNPIDCSLPGSSVLGISQARILEWVALSFSRGSSQCRDQNRISCISCIGRQVLYHGATREARHIMCNHQKISVHFSSVQSLSCVWLFATPWTSARLPVHHQLPESTQTHVHWVGDAIQPSHPLLSPFPPALNLSQHQDLFKWVSSSH